LIVYGVEWQDESGNIRKKADIAYSKYSPVILSGGTEENYAKPKSGSQCPRKNFEPNIS
jgi:hypothetical protein